MDNFEQDLGQMERESNPSFFTDSGLRVDFVLVQNRQKSEAQRLQNFRFITNLRKIGILVERALGVKYEDFVFIKLHAPDNLLKQIARIHGVSPIFENDRTVPQYDNNWNFFKTPISKKPNVQDPIFQRCSETVRGEPNTTFTNSERIMLVNYILVRTRFGTLQHEYGLPRLLATKNYEDAYPLHDGPFKWSPVGPLNDRQILGKFWAHWKVCYKDQPIHVIHKYYGPEIAFHYAWLGFYMKMLIVPSILGIIVFLIGCFELKILEKQLHRVDEVCDSEMILCPSCTHSHCLYKTLKTYCGEAQAAYVFNNVYTVSFAIFITIWSTFFLLLWKRRENMFLYKWNLLSMAPEIDELPEYRDRVRNYVRVNRYTHSEEHYIPKKIKFKSYLTSAVVCSLCVLFILLTVVFILITLYFWKYYITLYNVKIIKNNYLLLSKIYTALMSIIVMKICSPYLTKISKRLTDNELHRTQNEYLNAFILKSYLLSFFNTYMMIFYNAFFKNINYTHPGDNDFSRFFGIGSDSCAPSIGCVVGFVVHVFFTMGKDHILMIVKKCYIISFLKTFLKNRTKKNHPSKIEDLPQWEIDYPLLPADKFYFVQSFMGVVIEYGILVFFVSAVPLLPLLALINNIVQLRMTSFILVRRVKRNVPKRVHGLGAWVIVLTAVTRFSYFISGCVIAFNSEFVHRLVYYTEHGNHKGIVNDTVSEFLIDDYKSEMRDNLKSSFPGIDTCFYPGLRNPFNHTEKYQSSDVYYKMLSIELVVIVVFMQIVYFLSEAVIFWIPKMPTIIKESQAYEERKRHMRGMDLMHSEIGSVLDSLKKK